jgi:hypothetical protein
MEMLETFFSDSSFYSDLCENSMSLISAFRFSRVTERSLIMASILNLNLLLFFAGICL